MSKRFYPQTNGERKKAKLDISISDHNFPLSQNNEFNQGKLLHLVVSAVYADKLTVIHT